MKLPEESIEQYESKLISAKELIQDIALYDRWIIGMDKLSEGGFVFRVYVDEKGEKFLNLFSKQEFLENYGNLWGKEFSEGDTLVVSGYWFFQNLPTALDYINIDPDTEHSLLYKKEQFELLMEIGSMLELNIPLNKIFYARKDQLERLDKEFLKVGTHNDFFMILKGTQTPLAPDDRNRKILPVFTSKKSASIFVEWLKEGEENAEFKINQFRGKDLFQRLVQMPIDGIVFNCLGPITPIAFTLEFCKKINSILQEKQNL